MYTYRELHKISLHDCPEFAKDVEEKKCLEDFSIHALIELRLFPR